jgi:hypothetical protein
LSGQRIALAGTFRRPDVKSCHNISDRKKIKAAIGDLGGTLIAYKDVYPGDIRIHYAWDCFAYTDIENSDFLGLFSNLLTLGLLPSLSYEGELRFDVEIKTWGGRKIYEGHFTEVARTLGNMYTNHTKVIAKDFGKLEDVVIGKFINDIDTEGVFE